jgi:uncharacterized protein YcbK (DUF882 family)
MTVQRRSVIFGGLAGVASVAPAGWSFAAHDGGDSALSFCHLHTGEHLSVTYREDGRLLAGAVAEIAHLLRDFRTDEVHDIDVNLLGTLVRAW